MIIILCDERLFYWYKSALEQSTLRIQYQITSIDKLTNNMVSILLKIFLSI